jgi:hypothetical protein
MKQFEHIFGSPFLFGGAYSTPDGRGSGTVG